MSEGEDEFSGGGTPIGAIRPPSPPPNLNNPYAPSEPQGMAPQGMVPPGMMPPGMMPQEMMQQGMVPPGMMPPGMMPPGMMPPNAMMPHPRMMEGPQEKVKGSSMSKAKMWMKEGWKESIAVFVLFLLLNAPIVYKYLGRFLPSSIGGGTPSLLAVFLNAILAALIFFGIRKCLATK